MCAANANMLWSGGEGDMRHCGLSIRQQATPIWMSPLFNWSAAPRDSLSLILHLPASRPITGFALWPINVYQSLLRRTDPQWKHCRKHTRTSLSRSIWSPASIRPASKSSLIKAFSSSVSFESSMSPAGPPGSTVSPSASHRAWFWGSTPPLDEMEKRCLEAHLFLDL